MGDVALVLAGIALVLAILLTAKREREALGDQSFGLLAGSLVAVSVALLVAAQDQPGLVLFALGGLLNAGWNTLVRAGRL